MPGTHGPKEPSPGPKNPRTQPNGPRTRGMGPSNPEPRDPPGGDARAPSQGGLPHPSPQQDRRSQSGPLTRRRARSRTQVARARSAGGQSPRQSGSLPSLRAIGEQRTAGARSQGVGAARVLEWRVPVQLADRADVRASVFFYYVPSGNNEPQEKRHAS